LTKICEFEMHEKNIFKFNLSSLFLSLSIRYNLEHLCRQMGGFSRRTRSHSWSNRRVFRCKLTDHRCLHRTCQRHPGVNCTNILLKAFMRRDPKFVKIQTSCLYLCVLSGYECTKASSKMFMKKTPAGVNFTNILCTSFSHKSDF